MLLKSYLDEFVPNC